MEGAGGKTALRRICAQLIRYTITMWIKQAVTVALVIFVVALVFFLFVAFV